MIINCPARLQRLLLLDTEEERGQYLPGVIMLFGLQYCDIVLWLLSKKHKRDLLCGLK